MACQEKEKPSLKPGIDFVKLEELITEVCDNGNIVKELLYSMLRTTETYNNCMTLYNSYLDRYIEFLASLNITDVDMIAFAYKKMLDNGYLSYNKKHGYDNSFRHIYNSNLNISSFMDLDELEGCYVATGSYVCRHMSSFLTDLEGRAGENGYNTYVATYRRKKHKNGIVRLNSLFGNRVYANHQITCVDNEGFYGYCPTSGLFIQFENYFDNKCDKEDIVIYGRSIDIDEYRIGEFNYYVSYSDYSKIMNNPDEDITTLFNNHNKKVFKHINISDLQEKDKYVSEVLDSEQDSLKDFYIDTEEYLSSINSLMNTMVPKKNLKSLLIK